MSDAASNKPAASMLYVTCGSVEQAHEIGRAVVEEQLAACANIIDGMRSVYRWEGMVEEANEVVLILKTRRGLIADLTARVKALHSFDVPCVVEIPLEQGNADYFAWIADETAGAGD
ncbi:MAG: divalent-cation tolerance protein CutA [Alphaproteobacteria bacterium]|nr:divalent-cation tolerance protein CutA [Alphaproteobacteria bacterium]